MKTSCFKCFFKVNKKTECHITRLIISKVKPLDHLGRGIIHSLHLALVSNKATEFCIVEALNQFSKSAQQSVYGRLLTPYRELILPFTGNPKSRGAQEHLSPQRIKMKHTGDTAFLLHPLDGSIVLFYF